MTPLPSYLFPDAVPTEDMITRCHNMGLISNAVQAYISREALMEAAGGGSRLGFQDGGPKFWRNGNMASTLPEGACFLDGTVHPAGQNSLFENKQFSQSAWHFYGERPSLLVPHLVEGLLTPEEWGRISVADGTPMEFPLGEIRGTNGGALPTSVVLAMIGSVPWVFSIDEAVKRFPIEKNAPATPVAKAWKNDSSATGKLIADMEALGFEGADLGSIINMAARKTV